MTFIDEINEDIKWRMTELATIKTLPFKYSMSNKHKEFLIKYSIPSIYSVWEGFVKNSFSIYRRELNKLNLNINEICINLLTHHLDIKCKFNNPRNSFKSKIKLTNELNSLYYGEFTLIPSIPTKSNVNLEVLNNILSRFNIDPLEERYKSSLDKFLNFRNKISHGEKAITVNKEHINEFCKLVEKLMEEVTVKIESSYKDKKYIK